MTKTQEERVADAAQALRDHYHEPYAGVSDRWSEIAKKVLEAADREKSVWPTDESLGYFLKPDGSPLRASDKDTAETVRGSLRAAMLADPIVKAAVAVVARGELADNRMQLVQLHTAVHRAGF